MKKFALVGVLAGVVGLGGCGFVNDATNYLASPTTTQAAQNVGKVTTAIVCVLGSASGGAAAAEKQTNSAGQTVTGIIYVASSTACSVLGGLASGTAVVPASQVVAPVAQ